MRGELTRPRVKHLHDIGTRKHLLGKELNHKIRSALQELVRCFGVLKHPAFALGEEFAAAAFNHVGHEGPGGADEAKQRDLAGVAGCAQGCEFLLCLLDGVKDVGELGGDEVRGGGGKVDAGEIFGLADGIGEDGAALLEHFDCEAEGLRDHEDVGEDDGGVEEGVSLDGLEGDGGGEGGGAADGEEVVRGLCGHVLGEVTSGCGRRLDGGVAEEAGGGGGGGSTLAHHPHGGPVDGAAERGIEEAGGLGGRHCGDCGE